MESEILAHRNPSGYRLVPMQERFWINYVLDPERTDANCCIVVKLSGPLDLDQLKLSVNKLVSRHEVFRTTISEENGTVFARISQRPESPLLIEVSDLDEGLASSDEKRIEQLIKSHERQSFDLRKGPLFRFSIVRSSKSLHWLFLDIHHIIFDGESTKILLNELKLLYQTATRHQVDTLSPLTYQFSDYANWFVSHHLPLVKDDTTAFWQAQLEGNTSGFGLSPVKQLVETMPTAPGSLSVVFSLDLLENLKSFCRANRCTLFVALLSAVFVLAYRMSQRDDILIATPFANRLTPESDKVFGPFLSTIPLRLQLRSDFTLADVLNAVREVLIASMDYSNFPIELLTKYFRKIGRRFSEGVFPIVFTLAGQSRRDSDHDIKFEAIRSELQRHQGEFIFNARIEGSGLRLNASFNAEIYTSTQVQQFIRSYELILQQMIARDASPLKRLSLLSEIQREEILSRWDDNVEYVGESETFADLVTKFVTLSPDKEILVTRERSVTYLDLNRQANQFANYLCAQHVQKGDIIALNLPRSIFLGIATYGASLCGAIFVLLDPDAPIERTRDVLIECGVKLLIYDSDYTAKSSVESVCRSLSTDEVHHDLPHHSSLPPDRKVLAIDPCYITFTSGTTGVPKGIVVAHGSIVNWIVNSGLKFGILEGNVKLQFGSAGSELLVSEILTSLGSGTSLVFLNKVQTFSLHELLDVVRQYSITRLTLPSSYFHLLVKLIATKVTALPESLKILYTGMDVVDPEMIRLWSQNKPPHVSLFNTYGPAETTCVTTSYCIDDMDIERLPARVPIGKPIPNVRIYILDEYLNPLPDGVCGEIYIGGIGVALGYLNDPELTRSRFLQDPFSSTSGGRMYRTGDLGRFLPDGNIDFLGRIDHQVKIRGFRIELGEVETVFRRCRYIREVVVLAVPNDSGDKDLVLYMCIDADINSLRVLLKDANNQLPLYMRPSEIRVVDTLPRNNNGKVDVAGVSELSYSVADLKESNTEPVVNSFSGSEQTVITNIWSRLLKRDDISQDEDFFQLGGHSLLILEFCSEISLQIGVEIRMEEFFDNPTINGVATLIKTKMAEMDGVK